MTRGQLNMAQRFSRATGILPVSCPRNRRHGQDARGTVLKHVGCSSAGAGFTLIEVMLAVLILALLATAAAMSFAQPLRAARSQDLIRQLRSFDASTRQAAVSSGEDVRMIFDLGARALSRFDGPQLNGLRCRSNLPPGYEIDQIRIDSQSSFSGDIPIDVSPLGFSRSYGLHLRGPSFDQWIIFAGLGGDMTLAADDATTDAILAKTATATPGHNAD